MRIPHPGAHFSTCYSTVRSWAAAAETNPSKPSRRHYCASLPTFPCHPMAIMRHLNLHRFSSLSNALRQCPNTTPWAPAPISLIHLSSESLFHVAIDVSDHPDLINSHAWPGQYLQLRLPHALKPVFLAIASPPSLSASTGEFEFLVKSVTGSTAEALCRLRRGDVVELSGVMGRGFDMEEISPPEVYPTVLIFATGSGISPIRSLIESGFGADRRSDVRLYYGAKNLRRMAYQDRFKGWESSGVRIIPVLSQPDSGWQGERGYVQAAFARAKQISNPLGTGVVVCGRRQMAEEVTSILVADGVSREKILKNF